MLSLSLSLKALFSAVIIVAVAELGKRSSFWAAALASLPLTSLLAFVWLYLDTGDTEKIAATAGSIFWLVIPWRRRVVLLPGLLRSGWGFWLALLTSSVATALAYALMVWLLPRLGVTL